LKHWWKVLALATALVMACSASQRAQEQVGVYGDLSRGALSSNSSQSGLQTLVSPSLSAWGGTFGVYDNRYHLGPLRFGGDGRFFIESGKNNSYGNQIRGLLVGPRLALRAPAVPFSPYIQLEAGIGSTNYGTNSSRSASFAYQINGGLDYAIIPRLDARFEYGTGRIGPPYSGTHETMDQLLFGLVIRFP
jgi:opacity protein-like surface antigen